MKHLHISLFFSIYKQGYDSSDLGENPLFLLPKILGSFDAQNLNRLTVQKMGMLVSWQLRKLDFATFFKVWNLNFMGEMSGAIFWSQNMTNTSVTVFDVLCPAISTDWKEIAPTYINSISASPVKTRLALGSASCLFVVVCHQTKQPGTQGNSGGWYPI